MQPGMRQLTTLQKCIEALRWLCVLPAAVLGQLVVDFLAAAAFSLTRDLVAAIPDDSATASFASAIPGGSAIMAAGRLLLQYLTPKLAFTVAGAMMAPRHQASTAMLLALVGFVHSVWVHGLTNWLHVSAETAGLVLGTVFIIWRNRAHT
ncbi:MAG TPA: hypothetical protein VGM05_03685 [Planctomycetaceae bacterium]|jgi:hypothetical protein